MTKEEAKEAAKKLKITKKHFEEVLKKVKPSLTKEDVKKYEKMIEDFHRMYA
jgi:transitional endoplasmic reticulum ATPase